MEKAYETYKDSGVEWIGEIPVSWKISPLKYYSNIITGNTPSTKNQSYFSRKNGIPWVKPNDLGRLNEIHTSDTYLTNEGLKKARIVKKGSVLIGGIGNIGKLGVAGVDLTTNQQIHAIEFKDKFCDSFGKYVMLKSKSELESSSSSVVVSILTKSDLGELKMPIPNFSEQTQIAAYLDYHTGKIDQLIAKKESLIQKLQEQHQAIINEAVNKGFNPDVEIKDSGIEWLGKVPEHWEVVKLKYLINHSTIKGDGNSNLKIALENIESNTGKLLLNESKDFQGELKIFEKGDVLFNKLRPYLAKVIITPLDGECVSELLVFKAIKNLINNEFLFYRLISEQFISVVDSSTYGAKMPRASVDFILNLPIALPSIKEQIEITKNIGNQLSVSKSSESKTKTSIQKLKAYRQSLISEAVTGKIDVRDWEKTIN